MRVNAALSSDGRRLKLATLATLSLHGALVAVALLWTPAAPKMSAPRSAKSVSARFLPPPKVPEPAVVAVPLPTPLPTPLPAPEPPQVQAARPVRTPLVRKPRPPSLRGQTLVAKVTDPAQAPSSVAEGSGGPAQIGGTETEVDGRPGDPVAAEPGPPQVAAEPPPPPNPEKPVVEVAREVLQPPDPLQRPMGRYPPGLLRPDVPVRVVLILDVSAAGEVVAARVTSGAGPQLDQEALALVKTIPFRPASRGGRPVALSIPWAVTFR
jgi:TonB family protein